METTMENVNERSTKKEILSALKNAQQEIRKMKAGALNVVEEKKLKRREEVLHKVSNGGVNGLLESIEAMKGVFADSIFGLSKQVSEKIEKLQELEEAIVIKSQDLKELYDIEREAELLAGVVDARRQAEAEFADRKREIVDESTKLYKKQEKEVEEKIDALSRAGQEKVALMAKEQDRARAEWEYEFERKKREKNNELLDAMELKMKEFRENRENKEKEIQNRIEEIEEREAKLNALDQETEALKIKIADMEKSREEEISAAEEKAKEKARTSYHIELSALKKMHDAGQMVLQGKVDMLQEALGKERAAASDLQTKLDKAYSEIRSVAMASFDSQANAKMVENMKAALDTTNQPQRKS
jgi:hypothetical protein